MLIQKSGLFTSASDAGVRQVVTIVASVVFAALVTGMIFGMVLSN